MCASRIVANAMENAMALTSISWPASLSEAASLEGIFGNEEAADDRREEAGGDKSQALLDEAADRLAVDAQQFSLEEEARAAGDERQYDEHEKVVAGKSGGNGYDLERDWGQALDQYDPGPPFGIGLAKRLDALAIAVERDQPLSERVVEQRADGVAEHAAEYRGDGADERIEPRLLLIGKRHWDEDDIRRNGEERAFGEGHAGERRQRVA